MHSSSSEEMLVRTRKDKVVLHPGKLTAVRCCAHTQTEQDAVTLFCHRQNTDLPEGLHI